MSAGTSRARDHGGIEQDTGSQRSRAGPVAFFADTGDARNSPSPSCTTRVTGVPEPNGSRGLTHPPQVSQTTARRRQPWRDQAIVR